MEEPDNSLKTVATGLRKTANASGAGAKLHPGNMVAHINNLLPDCHHCSIVLESTLSGAELNSAMVARRQTPMADLSGAPIFVE